MKARLLLLAGLLGCRPPVPSGAGARRVSLLAMNDWHAAFGERETAGGAVGGLPWLAAAVDARRAVDPELLLLDAGDGFQGDPMANARLGQATVDAFALLGVDAAAVGNHGVQLIATAHAETLAELVNNKAMAPVLGDFEECTLSDREAMRRSGVSRWGNFSKVRNQRIGEATFDAVVELRPPNCSQEGAWRVILDVNGAIDAIVEKQSYPSELRFYDDDHVGADDGDDTHDDGGSYDDEYDDDA